LSASYAVGTQTERERETKRETGREKEPVEDVKRKIVGAFRYLRKRLNLLHIKAILRQFYKKLRRENIQERAYLIFSLSCLRATKGTEFLCFI